VETLLFTSPVKYLESSNGWWCGT
jgi:hypothetical protein